MPLLAWAASAAALDRSCIPGPLLRFVSDGRDLVALRFFWPVGLHAVADLHEPEKRGGESEDQPHGAEESGAEAGVEPGATDPGEKHRQPDGEDPRRPRKRLADRRRGVVRRGDILRRGGGALLGPAIVGGIGVR